MILILLRPLRDDAQGQEAAMNFQHLDVSRGNRATQRFIFSNLNLPDTTVDLVAGQGWGVRGKRRQQTLYCLRGSIWVTQEGDIRDYMLEAGDAFLITLPGLVMVRAMTPARLGYSESLKAEPFKGRFSQTVFN
jgi:hypothetical protein